LPYIIPIISSICNFKYSNLMSIRPTRGGIHFVRVSFKLKSILLQTNKVWESFGCITTFVRFSFFNPRSFHSVWGRTEEVKRSNLEKMKKFAFIVISSLIW
jgi:hypothetical protein